MIGLKSVMKLSLIVIILQLNELFDSQVLFNPNQEPTTKQFNFGSLPFESLTFNNSIAASFSIQNLYSSSAYKYEKVYWEERDMNCYKVSLSYTPNQVRLFVITNQTFVGFDYTNQLLEIGNRTFSLNDQTVFQYFRDSEYISTLSNMPISVLNSVALIKVNLLGNANLPGYQNMTLIYGGFTISLYSSTFVLLAKIQITIYLDGSSQLAISEMWNNTMYIGVFDQVNDRLVISQFSSSGIKIEMAIFDFGSLPNGLFRKGQSRSIALSINPINGILVIIVLTKTSPIVKISFNVNST